MMDGICRIFGTIESTPSRHIGFRDGSNRNNLIVERARRAYKEGMRGAKVAVMCAPSFAKLGTSTRRRPAPHHGGRRRNSAVVHESIKSVCAACHSDRHIRQLDEYVGFCRDCLYRSRVFVEDELGGEG